jgi:hypothetical protein
VGVQVIPTKTHGVLDFVTVGTLFAAPGLFGLKDVPRAASILRLAGRGAAAYSLLTDYEFGAVKLLPMSAHLAMDAASGALLVSSPRLFGFAKNGTRYWLPHALVGASEILVALMSRTR